MDTQKLLYISVVLYVSVRISNAQQNRNVRTCTPLKSNSINIQCQRGFRKISCEERMLPGSKGNLACKQGYQLHSFNQPEFTQLTCGDDGIWDNCLFSCDLVCGNPTPVEVEFKSDPPITYLAGQYPWYAMVYIRTEDIFNGTFMYRCGASIINHRMAITVAGCAYKPEVDLNDMRLVVGSSVFRWNRTEDEYFKQFEIEKIIVPKTYTVGAEGDPDDIAIVLVKGSFMFSDVVKPICIDRNFNGPIEEIPVGAEGYLTGFNTDRQTLESIRFVYNITLAYITNVSCRDFEYPFKRYYESHDKFCAGSLSLGYNIPFGFIGGGYFLPEYKDFKVVNFLRGIAASYGRGVDFFAITDIHVHLPWILEQEKLYLIDDSENPPEFCGPASRVNGSISLDGEGSCTLPPMPSNGRYFVGGFGNAPVGSSVSEWTVLKYQCNRGYSIRGGDTSLCNGGSWSNSAQCLQLCKPLTSFSLKINCSLNNKEVSCDHPMAAGTVAHLSCKEGYTLHYAPDNTRITCGEEGSWSASPFKCTPVCGLLTPKGGSLVIGGSVAKTGDFPWHAGIYEKSNESIKLNKQICGGSIINAKMVLSAAHCFYPIGGKAPYDKNRFSVVVGKIYRNYVDERDLFSQYNSIDRLLIPPTYDDILGNYASDIAIVILQFALTLTPYVRPICVQWDFRGHEEELKPNTPGIVSGWGLTSEGGEPSEILKSITLPSVPRYQCRDSFSADFRPYLSADKFCAGYQNGSSVCRGDSGGGLIFPQNIGQNTTIYFLRGVVSVGPTKDGTCDSNQYTVFTSVLANLEWMKNHRAHISV